MQRFFLSYPDEQTLRNRVKARADNNYGKQPGEIEDIISYWKPYESSSVASGAVQLNCTNDIYTPFKKITS